MHLPVERAQRREVVERFPARRASSAASHGNRSPARMPPAAPELSALSRYSIAVCEIVRNMNRRIGVSANNRGITAGTTRVRMKRAIGPSLVTAWNARSVVAINRCANAIRSGS